MAVEVRAIADADLAAVGRFLHERLTRTVSAEAWAAAAVVPWKVDQPNFGYLLVDDNRTDKSGDPAVVGVHLAFYSEREIDDRRERFCNLGAWCVADEYRFHGIKLLRALLRQDGYTFTDLSPSGSVIPLNERLKFTHLDTATALVPCLPWPSRPGRVQVYTGAEAAAHLAGAAAQIFQDHADAAAAQHVVLKRGDRTCYVIYRRDRRKNLPIFASILFVSDHDMFRSVERVFLRHLLRQRVLVALAERRIVGYRPRLSVQLRKPRRKMVKSSTVRPEQIDDLYSELTCVAW